MLIDQKNYWNDFFSNEALLFPICDCWLEKYLSILQTSNLVLDLGCGNGVDTLYLAEHNVPVVACDFSENALLQLKKLLPKVETSCFDLTGPFPFASASVDVILADLVLHFFDQSTTTKIIQEIFRVLKPGGSLICRVNSTKEFDPLATYDQLEPNFYLLDGCFKRLFDRTTLVNLFSDSELHTLVETTTDKYRFKKYLWELHVSKPCHTS